MQIKFLPDKHGDQNSDSQNPLRSLPIVQPWEANWTDGTPAKPGAQAGTLTQQKVEKSLRIQLHISHWLPCVGTHTHTLAKSAHAHHTHKSQFLSLLFLRTVFTVYPVLIISDWRYSNRIGKQLLWVFGSLFQLSPSSVTIYYRLW